MYVYDEYDQRIVEDRVKQFRDQTRRYLAGELSGEEPLPDEHHARELGIQAGDVASHAV